MRRKILRVELDASRVKEKFQKTKFEHEDTLKELNDLRNEMSELQDKLRNVVAEPVVVEF